MPGYIETLLWLLSAAVLVLVLVGVVGLACLVTQGAVRAFRSPSTSAAA